jgi:hypothetical protein
MKILMFWELGRPLKIEYNWVDGLNLKKVLKKLLKVNISTEVLLSV